jgi:hypothetical protein
MKDDTNRLLDEGRNLNAEALKALDRFQENMQVVIFMSKKK